MKTKYQEIEKILDATIITHLIVIILLPLIPTIYEGIEIFIHLQDPTYYTNGPIPIMACFEKNLIWNYCNTILGYLIHQYFNIILNPTLQLVLLTLVPFLLLIVYKFKKRLKGIKTLIPFIIGYFILSIIYIYFYLVIFVKVF